MFKIKDDLSIHLTRGDIANIVVSANLQDGKQHNFEKGDVVRLRVYEKKNCGKVVIRKDAIAEAEAQSVTISLTKEDTKIGELINKPVDYWYEIEVNPDTMPQTIVGYDESGEKIFCLYPEGSEKE